MKNKIIAFFLLAAGLPQGAVAQRLLSLDSCRAMALRNNKQLSISRVKQEVAANVRKSARTKYLPHVSALGGYESNQQGNIAAQRRAEGDALEFGNFAGWWYWRKNG